jgi:ribose transport system substrate-binding protein
MPKRRYLLPALAASVIPAVLGCAFANAESAAPKVGFSVPTAKFSFAQEMMEGFGDAVAGVGGVDYQSVGPAIPDPAQQVKQFQDLVRESSGGVAVSASSSAQFAAPMSSAKDQGVPVIAVDSRPPASSGVRLFIGNDNHALGELLADELVKAIPVDARGTVVLGTTNPGIPVLDRRVDGIRDGIRRQRPGVDVVGAFDTKQEPNLNLATWQSLVAGYPDALAFAGTSDTDAISLGTIHRDTDARWAAGGFDIDNRSLEAVKGGDLVVVSPEHFVKGAVAGRLLAHHAKHGDDLPEGWIYTPGLAVTQTNVDEIIARQASPGSKRAWFAAKVDDVLTDASYRRPLDQVS